MYNDDDFNEEEVESSNQGQNQNKILEFYEANKKLVWILGGIIVFILVFSIFLGGGGNNTETPNNKVELIIDSLSERISIKNTTKLYAQVTGNSNADIKWSSSNPSVATVDSNGIVTGIDYGSAIITATYTHTDGEIKTARCEVIVAEGDPNLPITSVEFPEGELMMSVGGEYELTPTIKPTEGYVTGVKYVSYNKDVVEVSQDGFVKALKAGKATITLDVNNGEFEDEINVHVVEESIISQIVVNPTQLSFIDKLLNVEMNETIQLEYEYQPFNASISNLKWESSDPTVATVENGQVKGLKIGTTEITVTALNGKNDIMTVTVIPQYIAVSSVEILNEKNVSLTVGGVHTIIKDVLPGDASNKNVTYKSSNSSVATVDSDGQVRAVSAGSATITVTSEDGNKTATVNITVTGSSSGSSGGNTGGSTGGGSGGSSVGRLSYIDSSGKNQHAKTSISEAKKLNHVGPITVSLYSGTITKLELCVKRCVDQEKCNTNRACTKKEVELGSKIQFTEGNGLYVIQATAYNGSTSRTIDDNFVNITNGSTSTTGTKKCYLCGTVYKYDYISNLPSSICDEIPGITEASKCNEEGAGQGGSTDDPGQGGSTEIPGGSTDNTGTSTTKNVNYSCKTVGYDQGAANYYYLFKLTLKSNNFKFVNMHYCVGNSECDIKIDKVTNQPDTNAKNSGGEKFPYPASGKTYSWADSNFVSTSSKTFNFSMRNNTGSFTSNYFCFRLKEESNAFFTKKCIKIDEECHE